jgi:hypothetical protein
MIESGENELPVITRCYELVREMTRRTAKLPRDLKFVLGDRILNTSYDILEALITARYTKDKRGILIKANLCMNDTGKDIKASLASWKGHLKHGNTRGLQLKLLKPLNDIIKQTESNENEQH